MKRDAKIRALGKNAYNAELKDPEFTDVVKNIRDVQNRIDATTDEISHLSKLDNGKLLTPKRFLIGTGIGTVLMLLLIRSDFISKAQKAAQRVEAENAAAMAQAGEDGSQHFTESASGNQRTNADQCRPMQANAGQSSNSNSTTTVPKSLWPNLILSEHKTPTHIAGTSAYKNGYDRGAAFGSQMAQQLHITTGGMGRYAILDHVNSIAMLSDDAICRTLEFKIGYADGMEYGLGKRFWPELDKEDMRWKGMGTK